MRKINDGGAAFPTPPVLKHNSHLTDPIPGMTLRAWLASQALAGCGAQFLQTAVSRNYDEEIVAKWCLNIADALISELEEDAK